MIILVPCLIMLQALSGSHFQIYPGTIFLILLFALLFIFVFRHNMTLMEFIVALNTTGSQPMAIVVLIIGCIMLKICKDSGLDPTVAGGIIGVASNMLTNQFAKQQTELKEVKPTGTTKTTTDVMLNPPPPASNEPEAKP